jgi:uncharacterized surface protein with fasciclin (FAS1) repeats
VTRTPTRGAVLAATASLALALTACSSDDDGAPGSTAAATTAPTTSTAPATATAPFGAGCATLPAEGEGSVAGMSDDPVATAAGNSPALSTLVQAVQAANLVDTFNTTEDITVLAPVNPAFEAVPADALTALLGDTARLTAVLTHHVIPGRLSPEDLAGTHTTANNDEVTVEGSGEQFTISADQTLVGAGAATVVCGNVQTANATVYLVDQVLAPAA